MCLILKTLPPAKSQVLHWDEFGFTVTPFQYQRLHPIQSISKEKPKGIVDRSNTRIGIGSLLELYSSVKRPMNAIQCFASDTETCRGNRRQVLEYLKEDLYRHAHFRLRFLDV